MGSVEDRCIRWGSYRRREKGSFGGECGASHCNQLVLCCVKMHEPIELSFGVVRGWAQALMYGTWLKGKGWILGLFAPIGPIVSLA